MKRTMKSKILSVSVMVFTLFIVNGCTGDDTVQNGNEQTDNKDMTEFAVNNADTRTTGAYNGSGIDFYWTANDNLWVKNTAMSPSLVKNSKNNINRLLTTHGSTKTATAKFYFTGNYTDMSYPVRYTGKNAVVGDKVNISANQAQDNPNDAIHLGESGDCGTAIAMLGAGGIYNFMLEHKASYLTFMPYFSSGFASSVKVTQIKVTANIAITGEFSFDENGINLNSRPTSTATNTSITLKLNGGDTNGFPIPKSATPATNAAIMVLAPGTYSTFTVEYTLYDALTKVGGTVTKTYNNLIFMPGKNKKVAVDLQVPIHDSKYYMWDAQQHYWAGHESDQPTMNRTSNSNYPKTTADAGWGDNVTLFPNSASRSAKDCPNVNELLWYMEKGDPHWDNSALWSTMGHLYKGGIWLKKQSVIATENNKTISALKMAAPNGTNYTIANAPTASSTKRPITIGQPTNINNYFHTTAQGYYDKGYLGGVGGGGYYWSKTPVPHSDATFAYCMSFNNEEVTVGSHTRNLGYRTWVAE